MKYNSHYLHIPRFCFVFFLFVSLFRLNERMDGWMDGCCYCVGDFIIPSFNIADHQARQYREREREKKNKDTNVEQFSCCFHTFLHVSSMVWCYCIWWVQISNEIFNCCCCLANCVVHEMAYCIWKKLKEEQEKYLSYTWCYFKRTYTYTNIFFHTHTCVILVVARVLCSSCERVFFFHRIFSYK